MGAGADESELVRLRERVGELERQLAARDRAAREQAGRIEAVDRQLTRYSEALHAIAMGTASATGQDFFRLLVRHLAEALRVRDAYIGTLKDGHVGRISTLAVWADGAWRDNFDYDVADTPCAEVIEQGLRYHDRDVQARYPRDRFLVDVSAESYCGVPLRDEAGRVLGVLDVLHHEPIDAVVDLAPILQIFAARAVAELERLEAERSVGRLMGELQAVVQTSPLAVVSLDLQGRVIAWNRAATEQFGWSEAEVLGRELPCVPEEDRAAADALWARVMAGETLRGVELRRKRKDGTLTDVNLWAAPLHAEDGTVVGGFGLVADVTERKRAEEALAASERRLNLALDATMEGVWDWNIRTGEVFYSPRWIASLGYEPSDVPPNVSFWERLVHPEDMPRVRETLQAHFEGHTEFYECENRLRTKSGAWRLNRDRGRVVEWDEAGRPLRMVGTDTDITERKRLEEQLRQAAKMEAVGRLAGGVAHDFNNLLTVITGYSRLLLEGLAPGSPVWRQAEEIHKAGDRAATLTKQLLAFSSRQVFQPRDVDLNALASSLSGMLQRLIGEHVRLVTRFAADVGSIRADPGQIEQVIVNLVVNARDAMPEGGTLAIETANLPAGRERVGGPPGPLVRLTVRDSGHGMDAETRARIFEPFFTTKELGRGTGLGLATVFGIVTQSGGTIEVESEPGRGAAFHILLPRMDSAPASATPAGEAAPSGPGSETVLLVEDESIVRNFVRGLLDRLGYQTLEAADGQAALRLCESHEGPIHVLLTDVVMPGMNGRRLAELARERRKDLLVLFMSGYTDDEVLRRGVKAGGDAFLQKPFTSEALARKLRTLLDRPSPSGRG